MASGVNEGEATCYYCNLSDDSNAQMGWILDAEGSKEGAKNGRGWPKLVISDYQKRKCGALLPDVRNLSY